MTQHDLAHAAGVPQPSIARIESGQVIPRTATLITILGAIGHRIVLEPIGPAVDREAIRRHLAMPVPKRTRQALGRRASKPRAGPVHILRRLRRFGVPFVLIGELAEASHGSPGEVGRVIEVCVASTDIAQERLAKALEDLGRAASAGLRTVTQTASGDHYDLLKLNAVTMPVDAGMLVRVAALEDLIRVRHSSGAPKDREAAAVLEAIMDEVEHRDR
jgi:transcriptional regulator with XRE-family HTH domain